MNRSRLLGAAGLASMMVLGVAATPAMAQAPAAAGGVLLPEVVVTATKRAENLQDVPLSIAVASQQALLSQNLSDTTDLKRLVSGLQFIPASTVGNSVFVVRGVGTNASGYGLEQSVGVAFDGVPLARNVGSVADLVDIQRVEVLKGPQGMLFGKNASAGLLNIVSELPKLGVFEGKARFSYGTLNYQQYTGTVNAPVGENAALRLSAWKFLRDGFIHEVNTGQDMADRNTEGARLKFRWRPTDSLDVNLTGEWTSHDQNGGGWTLRQFEPANFTAANSGALIQSWELARGTVASPTNHTARGAVTPFGYYDKGRTGALTGQADYSLGGGTLTAIASYRTIRNDNAFDPYPTDNPYNQQLFNRDNVHYNQETVEVRYASAADQRFRYVAGLFYFHLKLHEDFYLGVAGSVPTPVQDILLLDLKNENYAAFGEATFDVTSKLSLIGGLRSSRDEVSGSMDRRFLAPTVIIPGFTSPGATFGPFTHSTGTTYNDVSWRLGAQYKLTPDVMLYATASRGYKGPGLAYSLTSTAVGIAQASNGIVRPETVRAYEIGLKSQLLDKRVTFNLSAFMQTFTDFQTSIRVPGAANVFLVQNAKQLKSDGVDLEAAWAVSSEFTLSADVNYNDARFTDYTNASCYPGQTAALGCVGGVQNLNGWRLASAPEWTTNLTARYETKVGSGWKVFGQANHMHVSDVVFNALADPHEKQGAYSIVNLSAGIRTPDDRWGLTVYGNNVGDQDYVDRVNPNAGGALYENSISYGALRTFGIALDAKF